MADNDSNSSGGVPPKPADAPKVQPKKETVRISLPPKPTSTSTIKLPSLPGGGKPPAAAPAKPPGGAGAGAGPGAPKPPGTAPQAPKPPTAAAPPGARMAKPPGSAPAAASAPRPASAAAPAPRGRAPAGRVRSSPLDTGLTIAAAVIGIGAVVSILLLLNMK